MYESRSPGRRRARARRAVVDRRREPSRRGATLITVCITMTVLLGMVGVGVDAARAYAFKTQLKTVTDAAAMAGAVEMARGNRAGQAPEILAGGYMRPNRISGVGTAADTALWADADVDAVQWSYNTRSVTASFGNDYMPTQVNGIRVTARYPVQTTFARIFGINTITISETTVAALGGLGTQSCMKPWAVSFQTLVNAYYQGLGQPVPPGKTTLTPAELSALAAMNHTITMLNDTQDPFAPGNIGQVITWTDEYLDQDHDYNGGPYQTAVASSLCTDKQFAIGDSVAPNPGQGAGQSAGAVADLCGVNGNPQSFGCTKSVKLLIWDTHNSETGANLRYHVAEFGVFQITQYDRGTGQASPDQVQGKFIMRPEGGGFSGGPCTMTCKAAIVR